MKIQENLVFNKYTGELVVFVDLGDPELNHATFDTPDAMATHVMVFYIRALAGNLKFSFAYIGTNGMSSYQIMTLF